METIFQISNSSSGFGLVQLRGSIPLLWSSPLSPTSYNPPVRIVQDLARQARVAWNSFERVNSVWGPCIVANLIDKKGDQGRIGNLFEAVSGVVSEWGLDVSFGWWDFHSITEQEGYDEGVRKICVELEAMGGGEGYEWGEGGLEKPQKGVVRTNCMDCLDRTNVVQAELAKRGAERWLVKATGEPMNASQKAAFRKMWSNNADCIALNYAGTKALKRDYTRYGYRSLAGKVEDGLSSGKRWVRGNWKDHSRQVGLDILLGVREVTGEKDEGNDDDDDDDDYESSSEGSAGGSEDEPGGKDGALQKRRRQGKKSKKRKKDKTKLETREDLREVMRKIYGRKAKESLQHGGGQKSPHSKLDSARAHPHRLSLAFLPGDLQESAERTLQGK